MNVFITSADLSQQVYTPITSPASKCRSLRPSVDKTQPQPPWQTRQKCFSGCRKNWLLEDLSRGLDDLLGRNSIFPHKTLAVWRRCFVGGMPMTPGIGTRGMGKGKVFDGWREFSSQMPVNTCCLEVLLSRRKWFFYLKKKKIDWKYLSEIDNEVRLMLLDNSCFLSVVLAN